MCRKFYNCKNPQPPERLGIYARYRDLHECHGTGVPGAGERSRTDTIISVTVLALGGRNVQKAVKLIFNWKCLFFLLFLVLALVLDRAGVRSIWMYNADLRRLLVGESHVLLRLGYRHYTAPGGVVFALTQLWCYLHFGSIKKRQLLALLAVQLAIFQLTSSRMPLLMAIFLTALVYVYQKRTARKNPLLHTAAAAIHRANVRLPQPGSPCSRTAWGN